MFKLINIKNNNLKEVKTHKIIKNNGKFTHNGLFSEQIFGPVSDYICQCGITNNTNIDNNNVCKVCGVEITTSDKRRKTFAKIKLPISVINPIFYDIICINTDSVIKKHLNTLINNENSILYNKDDIYYVITDNNLLPENSKIIDYKNSIYEFVYNTSKLKKNINNNKWKFIRNNIDKLMINEILVLPPDLRPMSPSNNTTQIVDKINVFYKNLLIKKEKMENNINIELSKKIYYEYFKQIHKIVFDLYLYILESLSKKNGLIRGHILGKRIDFSGRAVIVPEPTLNLDECILPYFLFLELFKIHISRFLLEKGIYKFINLAINHIEKSIECRSYDLFNICKLMLNENEEVCILNRQPSLHRLSMLGFKIKLESNIYSDKNNAFIDSDVIKLHPLVCSCYNSDFDGDQMAVYIPITKESKQEIMDKILVTNNLSNPSNSELSIIPSQDIILGIYALTSNKFKNLTELEEYKGNKITKSRIIFNKCLPSDYKLINYVISKKKLLLILNDIKNKYDAKITSMVLDNIKKIGFKFASIFGATISLDKCRLPDNKFKNNLFNDETYKQLNKLSSKETENYLRNNFKFSYMIESGSRGSFEQVRQLILSRGFISNFNGEIIQTPVKSSLLDGLTPQEFFISTYGSRKGLLDVAINTGISGYLSRKLIFACINLQKSYNLDDCGTNDCLEVYINNIKKAHMLLFRYYKNNINDSKLIEITKDNCNKLVGRTIYIRSPIFCRSYEICHKCYGNLWRLLKSHYIGVISAQSLGERSTQLVLRTFHNSGVASIKNNKNNDFKQDDIVSDLSIVSNLFHHFTGKNYKQVINELFDIYINNGNIHHIHIESIVSQLMWKNVYKWRLLKNRDDVEPDLYSIQKVPTLESHILGFGFSDQNSHLIKGLLENNSYYGIIDKIILGEKLI